MQSISEIHGLGLYPYPHKNEARMLERNGFGSFIDYFESSDHTSKVEITGLTPWDCEKILEDFYATAHDFIDAKFNEALVSMDDGETEMEWFHFQEAFPVIEKISLVQFKNRIKSGKLPYQLLYDVAKMINDEYYATETANQQND